MSSSTASNSSNLLIRRVTALTASQRQASHANNETSIIINNNNNNNNTPLTSSPSSPMSPSTAAIAAAVDAQFQKRWKEENNSTIIRERHYHHHHHHQQQRNWWWQYIRVRLILAVNEMWPWSSSSSSSSRKQSQFQFEAFASQGVSSFRQRLMFALLALYFVVVMASMTMTTTSSRASQRRFLSELRQHQWPSLEIQFSPLFNSKRSKLYFPPKLDKESQAHASKSMDYGGLYVYIFQEDGVSRAIYRDYKMEEGESTTNGSILPQRNRPNRDDDVPNYYAFDDDHARNEYIVNYPGDRNGEQDDPPERHCRRTNWHRMVYPTCNTVHELAMEYPDNHPSYLSHGFYRDVFTVDHHFSNTTDTLVLKQYRQNLVVSYGSYEYVRMDALVSERLSSSPRIADIYAHCGLGIVAEFFRNGDAEAKIVPHYKNKAYTSTDPTIPQNNLTATEKLHIALDMAEAIAELHGFQDGVIVHNDIQPSQFLFGGGGGKNKLKLNDFNRAEIMLWDEGMQEYCRYRSGYGKGNYRSPEEYMNNPLNEKIDVWSFGNNLYSLLTGRYIYYELKNDDEAKREVRHGNQPPIHPIYQTRSFAEKTLVRLIYRCWEYYADDRADIFEIINKLRMAVAENARLEGSGPYYHGSH